MRYTVCLKLQAEILRQINLKWKLLVEIWRDSALNAFWLYGYGWDKENSALTVCLLKNLPEEKIARFSELARDYYILVPDDAKAEKAIRTLLRLAYGRYWSKIANHYRSFATHAYHPWESATLTTGLSFCDLFNSDGFKAASKKGRDTQKVQALNHTNGTQTFARKAYEMVSLKLFVGVLFLVLYVPL